MFVVVYLVDEDMGAAMRVMVFHYIVDIVRAEPQIVKRHVEHAFQVLPTECLFDVL